MCQIKSWWTPTVRQIWVVSALLINKFGQGMMLGISSAMIFDLRGPDSPIKINTEIESWLVSATPLATLSGFPIVSLLMNILGRKVAYCIQNVPAVIGMFLIGYGSNVTTLIIGRILCGITTGSTAILGTMVVGETTSPNHRGMFLTLKTAFFNLGSLFIHSLAGHTHWRTAAFVCMIPFIVTIAIAFTWRESPSWLAEKKKFKESVEAFYWLRGKTKESTREIDEIIKSHQITRENKSFKENVVNFLKKFKKRNFVKPLIVTIFMSFLLECSGRHVFPAYAAVIVRGMVPNNVINSYLCTLIIDTLITTSAFSSSYLIRRCKLRKLLFSTGFVSVVLLSLACLNYYLILCNVIDKSLGWVPIALMSFYFLVANLCCSSAPLNVIGEVYPLEHRAVGTLTSGIIIGVNMTIGLKITPYLFKMFDVYGALLFYGGGLAIVLVALYFVLPETKDKTLQDIEYFFVHGKYRDDIGVDNLEVEEKLVKDRSDNP